MSDKIRIGFPVPLTSVYGVEAHDQMRSAELAVEEFNKGGGLNGKMAELLVRDTKHNVELTRQFAIELIEKDKVDVMVGALSASDMVMIGAICSEREIVYNGISIGDGVVSNATRTPYIFHEGPTAFATAETIGRYAFSHFGFRVATLSVDHPYGRDSLRGLHNVGHAIGADFVADEFHALGESDFTPALKRVAAAKPEVLVTTNLGSDQINMITELKKMGLEQDMRVVCTNISIPMRELSGPDLFEGLVGGSGYYWRLEETYESSKKFNASYLAKHGMLPAAHGSYSYGAVTSVLAAARKMGSTDSSALIEGLLSLRFDFCRGPQFYRRLDHQSVQPVVVLESKAKSEMENERDLFRVLDIVSFVGARAFHISHDKV